MAQVPLFLDPKTSDDSIELSEIESLCTNCERNVSLDGLYIERFMMHTMVSGVGWVIRGYRIFLCIPLH